MGAQNYLPDQSAEIADAMMALIIAFSRNSYDIS